MTFWGGRAGASLRGGSLMLRYRMHVVSLGRLARGTWGIDYRQSTFRQFGFTAAIRGGRPHWRRWP